MANVDDRPARGAPGGKQGQAVGIDVGVPPPRPAGAVEGLLHVHGQEDGAVKIERLGHSRNLQLLAGTVPIKTAGKGINELRRCR
jgi:hypothetical protein